MTSRRRLALAVAGLVLVATAALVFATSDRQTLPPRQSNQRPVLMLLTSLPLVFGEQFSLDAEPSAAHASLSQRYRVAPISTADPAELGRGKLLLLAHPPSQSPEHLVALDKWVRGGGRLLLLADPMLEWPSGQPLGDPLRPPPMFMDTGLLGHWGLRLDAPDRRGPAQRELAGLAIATASPGTLHGDCEITGDRLAARCVIGRGRAIIVADADFLNSSPGDPAFDALHRLLAELER